MAAAAVWPTIWQTICRQCGGVIEGVMLLTPTLVEKHADTVLASIPAGRGCVEVVFHDQYDKLIFCEWRPRETDSSKTEDTFGTLLTASALAGPP
jgi:hypothetical protein